MKNVTSFKCLDRRFIQTALKQGVLCSVLGLAFLVHFAAPVHAQSVDLMELQRQNDAQRNAITPPDWQAQLERKNMALESQRLELESQRVSLQAQKQDIQNNAKLADGMAAGLRRGNTKLRLNSVHISGN